MQMLLRKIKQRFILGEFYLVWSEQIQITAVPAPRICRKSGSTISKCSSVLVIDPGIFSPSSCEHT